MQKEKRNKVNQLIGELVLFAPALLLCSFIDLWFECVLAILTILLFKRAYAYGYHADKTMKCIVMSYGALFICCCIGYVFKGQYLVIILLSSIIAYANNKLGEMQYKSSRFDVIKEPYTDLKAYYTKHTEFNVKTCTEDELVEQCRFKGLNLEQTAFCKDAFIYLCEKDLWVKYGGEFQSVINKKQYYRKILMDGRKVRENL